MFLSNILTTVLKCQTRRKPDPALGEHRSLAEADHYPHIALYLDQPGL